MKQILLAPILGRLEHADLARRDDVETGGGLPFDVDQGVLFVHSDHRATRHGIERVGAQVREERVACENAQRIDRVSHRRPPRASVALALRLSVSSPNSIAVGGSVTSSGRGDSRPPVKGLE